MVGSKTKSRTNDVMILVCAASVMLLFGRVGSISDSTRSIIGAKGKAESNRLTNNERRDETRREDDFILVVVVVRWRHAVVSDSGPCRGRPGGPCRIYGRRSKTPGGFGVNETRCVLATDSWIMTGQSGD